MEMPSTQSPKSFWERPEGKTGMFFLLVLGVAFVFFGVKLLPFVLLALQNTIMTVVMGVVLFAILFVLMDPKFRLRVGAIYQILMKWFTGWIVELDPIAIIESYLEKLEESLGKMSEQLDLLNGQEVKLRNKIASNQKTIQNSMGKAVFAKEKMKKVDPQTTEFIELKSVAALEGNKAARLENSNKELDKVLFKISNLRKTLEKMHASARFVLADMTSEVAIKKEEREAVLKGYSAFKSAMKVLDGNKDEKALFDESMEFIATDLGNKVGEIERFMQNSGSLLTSMDVENEMFAEKGLKMIEEWESKTNLLLDAPAVQPAKLPMVSDSIRKAKSTSRYLE